MYPGCVLVAGGVCSRGQLRPGSERQLCPQRYRVALLVSHLPVPQKLVQASVALVQHHGRGFFQQLDLHLLGEIRVLPDVRVDLRT